MIRTALSVVARQRPPVPTDGVVQRELADGVIEDLSRRLGSACALVDYGATRTGSLTIRLRADRPYVAKMPLRASTAPRLRLNAQALQLLGQLQWMTPFLAERCPVLRLFGMASGRFYSVETALPGRDGASILRTRASADELILSAERFILKLQKASLAESADRPLWQAEFDAAVDRVARLAERAGAAEHYRRLVSCVRNRLAVQPIPSVYSHGNFWLGNALFDTENALTGVIDWDCAAAFALPAIDFIYFLVRTHSLIRGTSFGEALVDWINAPSLPFLDGCLVRHCRELSLAPDLIPVLSYCCWIQHLDAHCRFGTGTSANARWLARNVRLVLHGWRLQAGTGPFGTRRWERAMEH
jgi:aminoglycoside phosphotransferase (APT) family kinase protein